VPCVRFRPAWWNIGRNQIDGDLFLLDRRAYVSERENKLSRMIEISDDPAECKFNHRHFPWSLCFTTDKYEDEYEKVVHEVCATCGTIRHKLLTRHGFPLPHPYRYERPEGYEDIRVGEAERVQRNLSQWQTLQARWLGEGEKRILETIG